MSPALSSADVTLDPISHEYRLQDGRRVPGVTEILAAVGVSTDFEAIGAIAPHVQTAIETKRDIGTELHAAAHFYDDDDLDWETVDERVRPYLEAWITARENLGLTPVGRERLVFHPLYFYAGTMDGVFRLRDGRLILVDIKTGDPDDAGCAFQTSAYQAAHEHDQGDRIDERWGIQLAPERAVPYRVSRYTAWEDFLKFQAFVTTYAHQAARRRR